MAGLDPTGGFNSQTVRDALKAANRSWRRRLTPEDVIQIRRRARKGDLYGDIAADYGVELSTAHSAAIGSSWPGLNEIEPPVGRRSKTPVVPSPSMEGTWIDLYLGQGWSISDISEETGATRKKVTSVLLRAGVDIRTRGSHSRRGIVELRKQVLESYSSGGVTVQALAEQIGKSSTWVRGVLREAGVEIVYRRISTVNTRPGKKLEIEDIVSLHRNGLSLSAIARIMKVHRERIVEAMEAAGEPIVLGLRGEFHPAWKGGRNKTRAGYIQICLEPDNPYRDMCMKTGGIWEHRYVMACALGRSLRPDETVHHIDGNRSNNEIGNLQLRHGAHGEGVVAVCCSCGSRDILFKELD